MCWLLFVSLVITIHSVDGLLHVIITILMCRVLNTLLPNYLVGFIVKLPYTCILKYSRVNIVVIMIATKEQNFQYSF